MNEKRIEELIDHIQRFFDEKFYPGEAAAIRFALRQCARECYEEAARVCDSSHDRDWVITAIRALAEKLKP